MPDKIYSAAKHATTGNCSRLTTLPHFGNQIKRLIEKAAASLLSQKEQANDPTPAELSFRLDKTPKSQKEGPRPEEIQVQKPIESSSKESEVCTREENSSS